MDFKRCTAVVAQYHLGHLAYLRQAGVVSARRAGKWRHYRISPPPDEHAARIFCEVRVWLGEQAEMQRDRARLIKICRASRPPVQLRGAPKPASFSR